jgi:hypothetical protein
MTFEGEQNKDKDRMFESCLFFTWQMDRLFYRGFREFVTRFRNQYRILPSCENRQEEVAYWYVSGPPDSN